MIGKLRHRHRWMAPVFLGMVPGLVLVGGIVTRSAAPVIGELPLAIAVEGEMTSERVSLGQIWDDIGLEVSVGRMQEGPRLIVEISNAPLKPDLLLFWSPAEAEIRMTPTSSDHVVAGTDGGQLPEGSVLLGMLRETSSAVFELPEPTRIGEGRLVLYSLPYRQVVSVSRPVNLN